MEDMLCPMCGGDEFDEIVVDGLRWSFLKGFIGGVFRIVGKVKKPQIQSYRCKNCENVQTFARK